MVKIFTDPGQVTPPFELVGVTVIVAITGEVVILVLQLVLLIPGLIIIHLLDLAPVEQEISLHSLQQISQLHQL